MAVAYVLDEVFAEHEPPSYHPERPERLAAIREALAAAGLPQRGKQLPVRQATEEEMGRVHTAEYLAELTRRVPGKSGWLDGDTYFSPGTWEATLAAAGAAVDVTAAVLSGECRQGLAVVRPPGHHAEADRAMGFCLVNNVAVAAASARAAGATRVAILDWDVHHGNGTQHTFYGDASTLYASCHQFPFYPGTGAPSEVGTGDGVGATINVGLPAGCGDGEYAAVFDEVFLPEIRDFRPDVILVSAGFDAYVDDPLAGMRVSTAGYRGLAARLCALADEVCQGRLVCVLEGGYHLEGLASGMVAVLEAMDPRGSGDLGAGEAKSGGASDSAARAAIEQTRSALAAAREGA